MLIIESGQKPTTLSPYQKQHPRTPLNNTNRNGTAPHGQGRHKQVNLRLNNIAAKAHNRYLSLNKGPQTSHNAKRIRLNKNTNEGLGFLKS